MALSTSDINLVDEQNKQHHADTTGYDYSSPVQGIIHSLVELRASFPKQPNPLYPNPGKWNYNGVDVTITQADINAYCAAHPQVCVSVSNRADAVEILKAGGTFKPDEETAATEEETAPAESESSSEETEVPPTPEDTTGGGYSKTDTFPPMPKTVSHKVKVKSWLALRNGPSTVKTNDNAYKDTELKGELLEKMNDGTELIVIDEGTGYNCEWLEVLVPGKEYKVEGKKTKLHRLFCSSKFVEKIHSKTSAELDCSAKHPNAQAPFKDWTKQTPNEPYFDDKDAKHKICVELMQYDSTGGSELPYRMEEAYYEGLAKILKENGKQSDSEYITTLLENDYYLLAHAEDYFLSEKPGMPLKVLVTIADKYLQPLEKASEVEEVKPGVFTAGEGALDKVKFRSTYDTDKFESTVEGVAKCLDGIAEEIRKFEGTVVDYDAGTEAERLRKLKNILLNLFTDNNITHDPFTKKETLTIGWDETLTPIYVNLTMEDGSSVTMAKAMTKFQDTSPIDSQRNQGYLWLLEDMLAHCSKLTWTEFVTTFSLPTPPEIKPGGDDEAGDVTDDEDLAEKESKSMDEEPAKSQTKKEKEDARLFDLELKKMLYLDRKDKRNFVGDSIASPEGLQAAIDQIETVDDAFNVVINKISVADLIQIAMSCLVIEPLELELDIDLDLDLFTDINSLLSNPEDIFDLSAAGAAALTLPKLPTIDLPDELPVTDIMASMANAIKDALMELLKTLFVMMIKAVLQALIDICQGSDSGTPSPDANLNDMLEDSTPDTPNKAAAALDMLGNLMDALGIPESDSGLPSPVQASEMQNMLDDVSLLLTPYEICTLINGTASKNTLNIVRSLILRMYPNFNLKSKTKLADFFKALGKMINPRICIALLEQPTSEGPLGDVLCQTSDEVDELRRGLLSNKGVTPDQIDELLDKEQQRRADTANALADMLNNGALADDYEPPPVFCTKGGEKASPGNAGDTAAPNTDPPQKKKGLIDLSHDSIDFMAEKVVDTLWAPTYMAFSRDAKDWHKAVVVKTTEKVSIPTKVEGDLANPYLEAKLGTVIAESIKEDGTYDIDTEVNKTAPQLQKAYEDFETNDALEFIRITDSSTDPHKFLFDSLEDSDYSAGFALKLLLPEDTTLKQAFANFSEFPDDIDLGDNPETGQPITLEDLTSLASDSLPKWRLYYVVPTPVSPPRYKVGSAVKNFGGLKAGDEVTQQELEDILSSDPEIAYEMNDDIIEFIDGLNAAAALAQPIGGLVLDDNPVILTDAPLFTMTAGYTFAGASLDDKYFIIVTKDEDGEEAVSFTMEGEGKYDLLSLSSDQPGVSVDVSGYSMLNEQTTPQQAVLAEWVSTIWKQAIPETAENSEAYIDLKSAFENPAEVATSNSFFGEMSRDMLAYIARRAALSPFFGSIDTPTGGSGDGAGSPSSTVISMINLAPERSPDCIVKGTDPHLLNIADMKKKALCDIKDNTCIDLDAPTDGSPDSKRSEMESALMKTVVRTTIRAYVIDQYMRGVFINSVFGEPEEMSEDTVNYVASEIKNGLFEYDSLPAPFPQGTYRDDFMEALTELYEAEKEDEEGAEQDYEDEHHAEDDGEHFHDDKPDSDEALKHYIRIEYPDVAAKLKQIFNVSKPDSEKDIHNVFIEEYLPLFDIPSTYTEPRFATSEIIGPGSALANKLAELEESFEETEIAQSIQRSDVGDYGFDVEDEVFVDAAGDATFAESDLAEADYEFGSVSGSEATLNDFLQFNQIVTDVEQAGYTSSFFGDKMAKPFDSTNGQFYLERYVKVVDHPIDVWKELVEYDSGPGGDGSHMHKRGHLDFIGSADEPPVEYWHQHGVMSEESFGQLLESVIEGAANLSKYNSKPLTGEGGLFAELHYGYRIMYLPPTDTTEFVVTDAGTEYNQWVQAINDRRQTFGGFPVDLKDITNTANNASKRKMISEKAYRMIEHFEGISAENLEGFVNATRVHFSREINPFPVATAEKLWSYASSLTVEEYSTPGAFIAKPSHNTMLLQLKNTSEYKLLTEYIFPLDRYKTLMSLYGSQAISTTGNVAIAYAETKDELYRLFHAVNAKGDYKQHDKALEKIGGNEGLAQTVNNQFGGIQDIPCLDFSIGFDFSFGLKGLGLSFILKMVIEAALIMFKKWVERFDLNISLAFALSFLSKLVCLNIPTTAFSFGLLPMNVFIGLPGIPISPQGFIYHALGMGLWKSVGDDNSDLKKQLKDLGFEPATLPCPDQASDACGLQPATPTSGT